ncbi:MAG: hypothetical protein PSV35_09355 [bacterium]|nr:hypothetical protein [bacterium]
MLRIFYFFIYALTICVSSTACATQQYELIIDAGSSGSRIFLYEVYFNNNKVPFLNLLISKSITPGLSSFAENPQAAISYLQSLLKQTDTTIRNFGIKPNQLSVYLYATAGMRTLSVDKQNAIYDKLRHYFATRGYSAYEVKTIDGRDEAIYDWLAVNYLSGTFINKTKSSGSLDMGGASAQISFETHDKLVPRGERVELDIAGTRYQLFAHSFLGLGSDLALKNNTIAACFPNGFEYKNKEVGAFDAQHCLDHIKTFLQEYHIKKTVPKISMQMRFYAFSKYYYLARVYNITQAPIPFVINYVNNKFCSHYNWSEMQSYYPLTAPIYLNNQCFSSEFAYALLKEFGFNDTATNLEIVDTINDVPIGWNIGAALARALKLHYQ